MNIKVSKEEAIELLDDVFDVKIVDQRRWTTSKIGIVKKDEKFYRIVWEVGSTEYQETDLFEFEDEIELIEVEKKEVVVKKWVEV